MVKVKIKASQPWPLQNEEHKRHSKEYIYEHDINDEETYSEEEVINTHNKLKSAEMEIAKQLGNVTST